MSTATTVAREAYSPTDFCEAFGVGLTTFWRIAKRGDLLTRKIGSRTIVLRADAEAWLASLPTGVQSHPWKAGRRAANAEQAAA
jgi:hypothetical protein